MGVLLCIRRLVCPRPAIRWNKLTQRHNIFGWLSKSLVNYRQGIKSDHTELPANTRDSCHCEPQQAPVHTVNSMASFGIKGILPTVSSLTCHGSHHTSHHPSPPHTRCGCPLHKRRSKARVGGMDGWTQSRHNGHDDGSDPRVVALGGYESCPGGMPGNAYAR